jgi:hypothetical protein
MTRQLKTVKQVMGLSIHHDIPPDAELPQTREEWTLDTHLDTLPPEFAAALRVEIAKGTLQVTLVPGVSGIRVSSSRPKARRPKNPSGA